MVTDDPSDYEGNQEATNFPDWGKVSFHEYPAKPWTELLPGASEPARDLASRLVCLESKSRWTAAEVRQP